MNSNYPKISIVTPSYNQGAYLERMILSIIEQKYPNLEFIIMDGGSTDESVEIIKKYEEYIDYWESKADNGQSHAINKGFKKATGVVLNWVNSDDELHPNSLEEVAKTFLAHPTLDILFSDYHIIDSNGTLLEIAKPVTDDFNSRILGYYPIQHPATFFSKRILDEVGLLNESFHYCMDADLFTKIALSGECKYIEKPLAKFRLQPNSKTSLTESHFTNELRPIYSATMKALNQKDIIERMKVLKIFDEDAIPMTINRTLKQEDINRSFGYFLVKQSRILLSDLRADVKKKEVFFESLEKFHPELLDKDPFLSRLKTHFSSISFFYERFPTFYDNIRRIYKSLNKVQVYFGG